MIVLPRYLRDVRRLSTERGVLFVADEIQSGLGRTGRTFACDHERVRPDLYLVGKALGGGIVPVSAVVGPRDVLGVLSPGTHGSTFGGNPLACAIGREVIGMLRTGEYQGQATPPAHARAMRERSGTACGRSTARIWAGLDLDDGCPRPDGRGTGAAPTGAHQHAGRRFGSHLRSSSAPLTSTGV